MFSLKIVLIKYITIWLFLLELMFQAFSHPTRVSNKKKKKNLIKIRLLLLYIDVLFLHRLSSEQSELQCCQIKSFLESYRAREPLSFLRTNPNLYQKHGFPLFFLCHKSFIITNRSKATLTFALPERTSTV